MPAQSRTFTYFTKAGTTDFLVPGSDEWLKITLRAETGVAPVVVGVDENNLGTNLGAGRQLPLGDDVVITIQPKARLAIFSLLVNRVSVQIEPLPWMLRLVMLVENLIGRTTGQTPTRAGKETVPIGNFGFTMPKKKKK